MPRSDAGLKQKGGSDVVPEQSILRVAKQIDESTENWMVKLVEARVKSQWQPGVSCDEFAALNPAEVGSHYSDAIGEWNRYIQSTYRDFYRFCEARHRRKSGF